MPTEPLANFLFSLHFQKWLLKKDLLLLQVHHKSGETSSPTSNEEFHATLESIFTSILNRKMQMEKTLKADVKLLEYDEKFRQLFRDPKPSMDRSARQRPNDDDGKDDDDDDNDNDNDKPAGDGDSEKHNDDDAERDWPNEPKEDDTNPDVPDKITLGDVNLHLIHGFDQFDTDWFFDPAVEEELSMPPVCMPLLPCDNVSPRTIILSNAEVVASEDTGPSYCPKMIEQLDKGRRV